MEHGSRGLLAGGAGDSDGTENTHRALQSGRRDALWMPLLLIVFALDAMDWWLPRFYPSLAYIQFTVPILGTIWNFLILLFPWMAFALALTSHAFKRRSMRILFIAALVPVMLITIPFALVELFFSPASVHLSTVKMDGYRVALYRLNCGAPCSFEIAVNQERTLLPPLMLVRNIYTFDPAEEARYKVIGKDELRVSTLPYDDEYPKGQIKVFYLKPFF